MWQDLSKTAKIDFDCSSGIMVTECCYSVHVLISHACIIELVEDVWNQAISTPSNVDGIQDEISGSCQ